MLRVMEALCLAPAGTAKVQRMLQQGGMGCADGGITGTFTPMSVCSKRLWPRHLFASALRPIGVRVLAHPPAHSLPPVARRYLCVARKPVE